MVDSNHSRSLVEASTPTLAHSSSINGSNRSAEYARMYSVLNQSSFGRSKTALDREIASSANSRISSASPSTSGVPSGGVQPSNARKFRKASGTMPSSR